MQALTMVPSRGKIAVMISPVFFFQMSKDAIEGTYPPDLIPTNYHVKTFMFSAAKIVHLVFCRKKSPNDGFTDLWSVILP